MMYFYGFTIKNFTLEYQRRKLIYSSQVPILSNNFMKSGNHATISCTKPLYQFFRKLVELIQFEASVGYNEGTSKSALKKK